MAQFYVKNVFLGIWTGFCPLCPLVTPMGQSLGRESAWAPEAKAFAALLQLQRFPERTVCLKSQHNTVF